MFILGIFIAHCIGLIIAALDSVRRTNFQVHQQG
jgi:hypothetical protein